MARLKLGVMVLSAISGVAIAVALFSVFLQSGVEQRVVTRVAGLFLLMSQLVLGRIRYRDSVTSGARPAQRTRVVQLWLNGALIMSVACALLLGYFIFVWSENLPNRKLYVAITCVAYALSAGTARLIQYFFRAS
jgi:high-affinity Fe2+/Pb2+ permease